MDESVDAKGIVGDGYDRLGADFSAWSAQSAADARRWFLGEVLARLSPGSDVLELGCGAGPLAAELSAGRRYVGVDLSQVQLDLARERVPDARFVLGDFTSMEFPPASFDGVVAFYVFLHVPKAEFVPSLERILTWLRPGGRLMFSFGTTEAEDRVEEWLGVPMFFAGIRAGMTERLLREVGFDLEISEIREEMQARYGPTTFHWVIARRPERNG